MLGPFDWYSAIEIGIAAAVVAVVVESKDGAADKAPSAKLKEFVAEAEALCRWLRGKTGSTQLKLWASA
jgi:hypothetical protein